MAAVGVVDRPGSGLAAGQHHEFGAGQLQQAEFDRRDHPVAHLVRGVEAGQPGVEARELQDRTRQRRPWPDGLQPLDPAPVHRVRPVGLLPGAHPAEVMILLGHHGRPGVPDHVGARFALLAQAADRVDEGAVRGQMQHPGTPHGQQRPPGGVTADAIGSADRPDDVHRLGRGARQTRRAAAHGKVDQADDPPVEIGIGEHHRTARGDVPGRLRRTGDQPPPARHQGDQVAFDQVAAVGVRPCPERHARPHPGGRDQDPVADGVAQQVEAGRVEPAPGGADMRWPAQFLGQRAQPAVHLAHLTQVAVADRPGGTDVEHHVPALPARPAHGGDLQQLDAAAQPSTEVVETDPGQPEPVRPVAEQARLGVVEGTFGPFVTLSRLADRAGEIAAQIQVRQVGTQPPDLLEQCATGLRPPGVQPRGSLSLGQQALAVQHQFVEPVGCDPTGLPG